MTGANPSLPIDELRQALEPLAREADSYNPEESDGHVFADNDRVFDCNLTVGQLRAARAVLAKLLEIADGR